MKNNKIRYGKDFMLVIVGQIVSLFGNAILRFSLPLYLLRETEFIWHCDSLLVSTDDCIVTFGWSVG